MLNITIDPRTLRKLEATLTQTPQRIPREVAIAINDTARTQKTAISNAIRQRIALKKADIDPYLKFTRATPTILSSRLTLSKSERIPLKRFGAKQTKRGVTYRIAKSDPRQRRPDAFGPDITRFGGHVFRRAGDKRLPIVKLFGPSPWGVFVKAKLTGPIKRDTQALLHKNIERRIKFILLKQAGTI